MDKHQNITRKTFLKRLSWLIALPYLLFSVLMVRKNNSVSATKVIRLKVPLSNGVLFYEEVIIIKKMENIEVFSSKCTHLGCRINKMEEGKLVCPCHGSTFDENGSVIRGPASHGLKKLPYTLDRETDELIITV